MRNTAKLLVLPLAIGALLVGCGSDDSSDDTSSTTTNQTEQPAGGSNTGGDSSNAGKAQVLALAADPSGALAYEETELSANAGKVTVDFTNDSHKEWKDPVSGTVHKESWADLMDKSAKDYERAHELLVKAKSGAPIEPELRAFVAGIDHDGVPVGQSKHFQTFIWPRWPL